MLLDFTEISATSILNIRKIINKIKLLNRTVEVTPKRPPKNACRPLSPPLKIPHFNPLFLLKVNPGFAGNSTKKNIMLEGENF